MQTVREEIESDRKKENFNNERVNMSQKKNIKYERAGRKENESIESDRRNIQDRDNNREWRIQRKIKKRSDGMHQERMCECLLLSPPQDIKAIVYSVSVNFL